VRRRFEPQTVEERHKDRGVLTLSKQVATNIPLGGHRPATSACCDMRVGDVLSVNIAAHDSIPRTPALVRPRRALCCLNHLAKSSRTAEVNSSGWFPDPEQPKGLRYFDGALRTEQYAEETPPPTAEDDSQPPPRTKPNPKKDPHWKPGPATQASRP